jgi:hypothetical protein
MRAHRPGPSSTRVACLLPALAAALYDTPNGDPPPGMIWWNYLDTVNPLAYQTPEQIYGPAYST